ncbi:hypothetical protein [Sulfitobacter sp. 20_GPM-1509m]|uniref:COG4315 family predicted lipoprotein n=1 Tax=Sulfitobacter sp. 20_GPM-1509m TaxID=1380367 RepID=UPI0009DE02FF|nr:hypothetical protein [Sulfitobacter sp. 20_GPM-1509m]
MTKPLTIIAGSLLAGLLTVGATFAANVIETADTPAGKILTNGSGMTLYVFDKDSAAISNCNGECADLWPPLEASNNARPIENFGIIVRADGERQWTYKGLPLYTWVKDVAPGDTTGDGVKGVWHIAKP